ncbi:Crp/Fnr family transcriptional regulator [Thiomicrorhabdus indica]|uniref:Crp/Fnr family transcriptional regulator n=1 Tax=Thiomicrorhabdus indica TaxID=2267253 RepID=UPI00102E01A3|nr:Crp/Fnr family transcriptional regulator [Thiomicrorhabdus indica]
MFEKVTLDISLKHIPLLKDLPDEMLVNLNKRIKYVRFQKNQFVIRKGEASESLIFVMQGELNVIDVNENGQYFWLANIPAGMSSGELGLISGEKRSTSIVASRESIVGFLNKKDALELILKNPSISWKIMQHMAKIIKKNNTQLALMNLSTAQERVEAILSQRINRYSNGSIVIEDLPSQESIATMANTSRETVSRIINKLVKDGVLEKEKGRKRYFVKQPDKLKDLTK